MASLSPPPPPPSSILTSPKAPPPPLPPCQERNSAPREQHQWSYCGATRGFTTVGTCTHMLGASQASLPSVEQEVHCSGRNDSRHKFLDMVAVMCVECEQQVPHTPGAGLHRVVGLHRLVLGK